MITIEEILRGQPNYPKEYQANLIDLHKKINIVRTAFGKPMIVTAGYRSVAWEKHHGRSGKSDHCKCMAIDIYDPKKELSCWCYEHQELLRSIPLWVESPEYTPNWVHFTTKPKSQLFFIPY